MKMETWITAEGRILLIESMSRHHAWNALRMLEEEGLGRSLSAEALRERLGHVSFFEATRFRVLNVAWRITHPFWRKVR